MSIPMPPLGATLAGQFKADDPPGEHDARVHQYNRTVGRLHRLLQLTAVNATQGFGELRGGMSETLFAELMQAFDVVEARATHLAEGLQDVTNLMQRATGKPPLAGL